MSTMDNPTQNILEDSSIDIASLNNMVVNLRSMTRKSKVQVIQKLNKTIKALQKKSSNLNDKRHKRAERLSEDVKILKLVNVDDITKFCLIQSGAAQSNIKNREQAAMVRVGKHKILSKKIEDLRKEHKDWDSLVFFIKNHIPRRVKKKSPAKKQKDKAIKKLIKSNEKVLSTESINEDIPNKPLATEETLAKLKCFGGVVHAFDADDDCDTKHIPIEIGVIDETKDDKIINKDHKSSKKGFFEGCDGDDDDDNINDGHSNIENNADKCKNLFKKNLHHFSPKKKLKKIINKIKYGQNVANDKTFVPEVREKKQMAKRPAEPLHPSWEAKRKEKEMMKNLKPQSKKIVFDD